MRPLALAWVCDVAALGLGLMWQLLTAAPVLVRVPNPRHGAERQSLDVGLPVSLREREQWGAEAQELLEVLWLAQDALLTLSPPVCRTGPGDTRRSLPGRPEWPTVRMA